MARNDAFDVDLEADDDGAEAQADFAAPVVVPPMPEKMVEAPTVKGKPCDIKKARGILTHLKAKSIEYWKDKGVEPPAGSAAHLDIDMELAKTYGSAK